MFSHTSLTARITGIRNTTQPTSIEQRVEDLCRSDNGRLNLLSCLKKPKLVSSAPPIVSLAPQGDSQTGTVTFPLGRWKERALKRFTGWQVDDAFDGLTVLSSAPEPNLDICAVHGLNGNAFDTWAWEGRVMWLRDFLSEPRADSHPGLQRPRVMTFGYSSLVRDKKNTTGLHEWSSELLQSVSSVRRSAAERSRPIIFVCHSLGGIVARQAMIRLGEVPGQYEGLDLNQCGLLFLGTPHSGTVGANWNDLLIELAKIGKVGRGRDFTRMLSAFNQESVGAKERFGLLQPVPPFICVYETQRTPVKGTERTIVEPDSAGLNGERAKPMSYADHRTICRFRTINDPRYLQVLDYLGQIRQRLDEKREQQQEQRWEHDQGRQQVRAEARGGDAQGGDATSYQHDYNAQGGHATGGGASARRGNAVGGSAVGGNASSG